MRALGAVVAAALALVAGVALLSAAGPSESGEAGGAGGPGAGQSPADGRAGAPAADSAELEAVLVRRLVRERAGAERERRRLVRRARAMRAELGELAEPLGRQPRNRWRPFGPELERAKRLRRQIGRERLERADVHFWLASNLRANGRLAALVRHPSPAGNRALAAAYFGWEYECAAEIIEGETAGTWSTTISNYAGSGAYGLGQALPASKMAPFGDDWRTSPLTQLRWFRAYAVARYESVCGAAAHWTPTGSW